jgi:paraquat-inducible protein A
LHQSARSLGLGCCPCCHKLNKMQSLKHICSRCGHKYAQRKPNSVQYTLAWTIAALTMFIPANIYPMMIFYTLGKPDASTILEGIAIFIQMGIYPVAIIIFIASFIIPLGKIFGLFVLMYHAKYQSSLSLKKQGKFYHVVEFLGPWSMLDVFVVAVMAAVVNLGFITSIEAGVFSGVNIDSWSIETLLSGGIAFATPEPEDDKKHIPVSQGHNFTLYEDVDNDWHEWAPKININK